MSAESGATGYLTPPTTFSFTHIGPDPDDDTSPVRTCSVRGCSRTVGRDSSAKMCPSCREKHRIYATTKRARRKQEKAAVQGHTIIPVEQIPGSTAWMPGASSISSEEKQPKPRKEPLNKPREQESRAEDSQSSDSTFVFHVNAPTVQSLALPAPTQVTWEASIAETTSFKPHGSTSELARALTLPNQPSTPHYRSSTGADTVNLVAPARTSSEVAHSATETAHYFPQDTQVAASDAEAPIDSVASFPIPAAPTGIDLRYCSVKGCKTIIPASYTYKMCEPCRNRYRGYGTKKRAKWKAEREALDLELQDLRIAEDSRRRDQGLPPLGDSPEELRAWELAVLSEKVGVSCGPQDAIPLQAPYSANASQEGYAYPTDMTQLHPQANGSAASMYPVRMCTVSHCHQVLPAHYLFKRCEQHRMQNRYHSRLKRVREKVIKAAGPLLSDVPPKSAHVTQPRNRSPGSETPPPRLQDYRRRGGQAYTSSDRAEDQLCAECGDPAEPGWRTCTSCRLDFSVQVETAVTQTDPLPGEVSDIASGARDYTTDGSYVYGDMPRHHPSPEPPSYAFSQQRTNQQAAIRHSQILDDEEPPALEDSTAHLNATTAHSQVPISSSSNPDRGYGSEQSLPQSEFADTVGASTNTPAVSSSTPSNSSDLPSASTGHENTIIAEGPASSTSSKAPSRQLGHRAATPYPYPYVPTVMHPQYPYSFYLPPPYGVPYAIPLPANGTGSAHPFLPAYPYLLPGYPYAFPPPSSVQTTTAGQVPAPSRDEKRARKRASSRATPSTSPSSRGGQGMLLTTGDDDHGMVFNHYQPNAAKRKRRKVQKLSAEEIQKLREQSKQQKLNQPSPDPPSQPPDNQTPKSERTCGNKTCRKKLPSDTSSTICDRCRLKFKKQQTKTKLKSKLEPNKAAINAIIQSTKSKSSTSDSCTQS